MGQVVGWTLSRLALHVFAASTCLQRVRSLDVLAMMHVHLALARLAGGSAGLGLLAAAAAASAVGRRRLVVLELVDGRGGELAGGDVVFEEHVELAVGPALGFRQADCLAISSSSNLQEQGLEGHGQKVQTVQRSEMPPQKRPVFAPQFQAVGES